MNCTQQMQYNAPNRMYDFHNFSGGNIPWPPLGAVTQNRNPSPSKILAKRPKLIGSRSKLPTYSSSPRRQSSVGPRTMARLLAGILLTRAFSANLDANLIRYLVTGKNRLLTYSLLFEIYFVHVLL